MTLITRMCFLFSLSALVLACSVASEQEPESVADASLAAATPKRPRFEELNSVLTTEDELNRWYTLRSNLRRDFDAICGDTFCEGDFSNYQSLALRCSVDTRRHTLERCVWVFAASQQEVAPATGAIVVTARHWECALPLAPRTRVSDFLAASSVDEPLYAPLPGTSQSAYDGLIDCL